MGQKYIIQGGNKTPITQVPINKVSFGTPFAGNSVNKTLSPAELVRALRFTIAAEYEAIQLYEQIAEATDYTPAGVALMSIAREEKVHAGELLEVLKTLDPEEKITYEEGEEEIEEVVGKCRKLLKGGPGSGRTPGDGKYNTEDTKSAYWQQQHKFKLEQQAKRKKEQQNAITRDAVYEEDKNRSPKDYHPEHPDNKSAENTDLSKGGPGSGRRPEGRVKDGRKEKLRPFTAGDFKNKRMMRDYQFNRDNLTPAEIKAYEESEKEPLPGTGEFGRD